MVTVAKTFNTHESFSYNPALWKELDQWGLGWKEWFTETGVALHNSSHSDSHPPYIVCSPEGNLTVLEIAVAGYDPTRIAVTVHRKTLTVSCTADTDTHTLDYSVHGIARRSFVKHFTLCDWARVQSAVVTNGMLTIKLVSEIPLLQPPESIPVQIKQ